MRQETLISAHIPDGADSAHTVAPCWCFSADHLTPPLKQKGKTKQSDEFAGREGANKSVTRFLRKCGARPSFPLVRPVSNNRGDDGVLLTDGKKCSVNLYSRHTVAWFAHLTHRTSDSPLQRPLTNGLCNAELRNVETTLTGMLSQTAYNSSHAWFPFFIIRPKAQLFFFFFRRLSISAAYLLM